MGLRETVAHSTVDGANDRIGQPCERLPRLPRRYRPRQDAYPDEEHVFESEHADTLEQILVIT